MAHLEREPIGRLSPALSAPTAQEGRSSPDTAGRYGDFVVEWRPLAACSAIEAEWSALAAVSAEPNIFYEPGFLSPAVQHLTEAGGHGAILVWRRGAEPRRLLGFWPMRAPGRMIAATRGFASPYASSGAPLLDRAVAVEAATAMLSFALGERAGRALLFPEVALDGAAARALRGGAALAGFEVAELDVHLRACLWSAPHEPQLAASSNLQSRMRANARRLGSLGEVRVSLAGPAEARQALELFLAIEASGWKGRRGTAILADPRDSAFYRSMVRRLAQEGKAAVRLLECGPRIAAGCIVLSSQGQSWYVKTAYDESLAAASPGALLAYRVGEAAAADPALELMDSCTQPGSPTFERLWKGRVRIGDMLIAPPDSLPAALRREVLRRRARAALKRLWRKARGWENV